MNKLVATFKKIAIAAVAFGTAALCATSVHAGGFDGKPLATNDWFDVGFTNDDVGQLTGTTGIPTGKGSWTHIPSGGAEVVSDSGYCLIIDTDGNDPLTLTPAALPNTVSNETISVEVLATPSTDELEAPTGSPISAFALYDNGSSITPVAYVAGGWTNLVYSPGAEHLTNVWFTLYTDFATVDGDKYLRFSIKQNGITILEDSTGETWFPAATNATNISSVSLAGSTSCRTISGDSIAYAVAEINGVRYESFAAAIAAAGEGDEISVLDDSAEVPAGWKIADGKLVEIVYVAQIVNGATTNKFETIAEAIAAVPNNTATTITILADVDLGTLTQAQVTAAGNAGLITIPAGKVITLDLNGHRLYGTLQAINSGYNKNHVLLNSGTLTVVDSGTGGSIENLGTECVDCCYTIENASGATMYLNGGTFSTASGALMINRGTCEINSGVEMICAGWYRGAYSNAASVLDNRGTATINGGTFRSTHEKSSNGKEATATIFSYNSTTIITGGTFIGQPENGVFGGGDGNYTVTGGSFSSDPQNLVDSTAYYVRESSGMYTVSPIVIEDYNVATSAELLEKLALGNAESRFVKCKLTSDITLSADAAVVHGSQIDLNGHTLTIGDGVILSNAGTIVDGMGEGTVQVSRTGFLENPYGGVDTLNVELVYANETDANGVYEISTPMDLQWLSYLVNTADFDDVTKIVFANDVAIPSGISFEMIGGIDGKEIDGNGKSVSGVVINGISGEYGMFEYLATSYVHDLDVTASVSTVNAQTGILTARIKGGTTLKNVTVNGRIDVSGSAFGVAGFAGAIGGGSGEVRIVCCTNNADIYAPNATIAGGFHGTSTSFANGIYYVSCKNTGDMTSGGYAAQSWGYGYDKLYLYDFTGTGTMVGATVFTGAQGGPEGTGNIIAASKVARTGTPTSPTFHDDLASAITAAATDGSTIMLLTDCADAYELTVGSALVVDEVAGECTGITAPSGYVVEKTVTGTIATYAAVISPVAAVIASDGVTTNGTYTTIQAAIAAAQAGETIVIFAKTIDAGSDTIVVDKAITITGAGKDETTLNFTATTKAAFSIQASNVTIENMTINQADTNTDNTHHISVVAAGSDACYSNVTLSNLKLGGGKYSMIIYGESFTIDGCDFASQGSSQILVDATKGNSRITNNIFTGGKYNILHRNSHSPTTVTSYGKLTISGNVSNNGNLLYILESANSIDQTQKIELVIVNNRVLGYTNKAVALTSSDELAKQYSSVTITNNAFTAGKTGRPIVQRDDTTRSTLTIDARANYWNGSNPDFGALVPPSSDKYLIMPRDDNYVNHETYYQSFDPVTGELSNLYVPGYSAGDDIQEVIGSTSNVVLTATEADYLNSIIASNGCTKADIEAALDDLTVEEFKDAALMNIDITQGYAKPVFNITAIKRFREDDTQKVRVTVRLDRSGNTLVSPPIKGVLRLMISSDGKDWNKGSEVVITNDHFATGDLATFTLPIGNARIFKAIVIDSAEAEALDAAAEAAGND